MPKPNIALTGVFLALHISGGIIGLPIAAVTIVASKQVSRHPTLINFCITWIISSLIYTLLLYAGHIRDENPQFELCLAQASLAAGAFPMTSVAGVALALHIWHGLTPTRPWSQMGMEFPVSQRLRLAALVLAPYVAFAGFTVTAVVVGTKNRSLVRPQEPFFYCSVDASGFSDGIPIFSMIAITVMLAIEATILIRIYQFSYGRAEGISKPAYRLFMLRLAGFVVYSCIAQAVCALLLEDSKSLVPYLLQASLPLVLFLCVGTQSEVLGVWTRCCNRVALFPKGLHKRSKSRTSLLRNSRPTVTSSFAGLAETVRMSSVHPGTTQDMEDVFQLSQPLAPAEAKLKDPVASASALNQIQDQPVMFGSTGRQPTDQAAIIESQQRTITRLLDESEHLSAVNARLKDIEKSYHRTQNMLVTERQKVSQMRAYVDRIEADAQNQTSIVNDLLARNSELCVTLNAQSNELERLTTENRSLTDAMCKNTKDETEWRDKHTHLEVEHSRTLQELSALKSERDALLDIWSSLESPVDWELLKPKRGNTPSRAPNLPELARRITQRSSTPARSSQSRQLQRRTTGASERSQRTARLEALDRMRPKLLALSGKMEMSEKVTHLEEIVREQTKLIEDLEGCVEDERREREEELEQHRRVWRAARFQGFSPTNSTIPSAGTLADALAEADT